MRFLSPWQCQTDVACFDSSRRSREPTTTASRRNTHPRTGRPKRATRSRPPRRAFPTIEREPWLKLHRHVFARGYKLSHHYDWQLRASRPDSVIQPRCSRRQRAVAGALFSPSLDITLPSSWPMSS